jgi:hypothetical protein
MIIVAVSRMVVVVSRMVVEMVVEMGGRVRAVQMTQESTHTHA